MFWVVKVTCPILRMFHFYQLSKQCVVTGFYGFSAPSPLGAPVIHFRRATQLATLREYFGAPKVSLRHPASNFGYWVEDMLLGFCAQGLCPLDYILVVTNI